MSATLIRAVVSVSSGKVVVVFWRATVGASLASVTVMARAALSSGVAGSAASSTSTTTSSTGLVSKSRLEPAERYSSVPSISNSAASAPLRLSTFVPRASSVTTMSATLIRAVVSVSSPKVVVVFWRATVGASLASVTVMARAALSSGVAGSAASSTSTTTSSTGLVSKSRLEPAERYSSVPSISNSAASAPERLRTLVPSASSVTTMSATLIRAVVSVSSGKVVVVFWRVTVGASLASVTVMARAALSSGVAGSAASSTSTVTSSTGLVSKSRLAPAER